MRHSSFAIDNFPVRDIEYDFFITVSVFKLYMTMFAGVFKYLLSDFYVLFAVFHDFLYLAFAPPADGLQAVR